MTTNARKQRERRRGAALIEVAIALPLLLLMTLGAADFGRLFHHSLTLHQAAGAAVFYGGQSILKSGDNTGMEQMAEKDAGDIKDRSPLTVQAERLCMCPDGTAAHCVTGSCGGYGQPRVYVKTRVSSNFDTLTIFPGIPERTAVGREGYLRAQ